VYDAGISGHVAVDDADVLVIGERGAGDLGEVGEAIAASGRSSRTPASRAAATKASRAQGIMLTKGERWQT
jgi:hypothetical protein